MKTLNFEIMKTKQFFLLIVAVAFAANVFATDIPKMSIIALEGSKALITVQNTVPEINEVSIITEFGEILYYKKSKKEVEDYKKIFDLSQLENGNYQLILKSGTATVKNDLMIKKGQVSVLKQRNEMEPFFAYNKGQVVLSYLNFSRDEMEVQVYEKNKLIFSKDLGNEVALHRMLNLGELKMGNYDILLADAHNEYWFSFSK